MKIKLDDLPGHAGGMSALLSDGSWSEVSQIPPGGSALRASCSCGWSGADEYPCDDMGQMSATSDWIAHMKPLWMATPPDWLLKRSDSLREALGELATEWPLQTLAVLSRMEDWQKSLTQRAVDEARGAGSSWAEIGAVLGIARQSAQQRFKAGAKDDGRTS